jgi:hypothetical protein
MRGRGRGIVLIVIVAMLTPTFADADDLGGVVSGTITVASPGDLPVVPTIIMADCFCTSPQTSIHSTFPEYVGKQSWQTAGAWSVSDSRVRPPTSGAANRVALYDAGITDVAIEADVFRVNKLVQLGLVARSDGQLLMSETMRRLQAVVANDRAVLTAWVGTTSKELANVDASKLPASYRLRLEIVDALVRVSAADVVLIEMNLPAPFDEELAKGTAVGLIATNAGNERVDDVLVTTWPP